MTIDSKIKAKIKKYFAKKPQVVAVYLYGSFARGEAKKDSDIDLGIILGQKVKAEAFVIPQIVFAQELTAILNTKVEVQDLSSCSLEFAHRVLSEGKLVFCRDHQKRIAFEERIIRKYFDLKPTLEECYKYLMRIAAKGELHVRYPSS